MTNNQAIQWINRLIQTMKSETAGEWPDPSYKDEVYIVLEMAIKALQFKEDYNDGEVWVTISKALYEKCLDAMEQPKRQTGEWIREEFPNFTIAWLCNKCGRGGYRKSNFCPNCGADMRGAE